MKNKLATIKEKLEKYAWFRERKNKNIGVAKLLVAQFRLEIDPKVLEAVITESYSLDRAWRKVLEENENLRGNDYSEDKDRLEQSKMLELGYEPRYHENKKKLDNI